MKSDLFATEVRVVRFLEDDLIDPNCVERNKACQSEPFFGEHEGKRYCVLHFPSSAKKEAFDIALERKVDSYDSNYQGVWFPQGCRFTTLEFRQPLDFTSAFFNERAAFYKTKFKSDVSFAGATFNEGAWFGSATFDEKIDFSSATFGKDADFGGATFFREVNFSSAIFREKANLSGARFEAYANFWRCTFTGSAEFRDAVFLQTASFWPTTFQSTASFSNASFAKANFGASEFNGKAVFMWCAFGFADFIDASFKDEADFSFSKFEGLANFISATFDSALQLTMCAFGSEARFRMATFNGRSDFSYTAFKDIVSFSAERGIGGFGTNAMCDFRHVRFESPRQVSFHGLTLRPHWFLILDPREFEFIDVKWIGQLRRRFINIEIGNLRKREELERKDAADRRTERLKDLELFGDQVAVKQLKEEEAEAARIEAKELNQKNARLHRLLSITCRQLAVNAEDNHLYDQASDFRFWSMELLRKEGWKARGRLSIAILHSLYRHLSGYGEEVGRAICVLLGIWLLFALFYTQVGFVRQPSTPSDAAIYARDQFGIPQKPIKAVAYSLAVMTLQRPDPRPLTATAWFAVLAETIFGPIQAALFALAVRRRFMR
jgi:hypothetical protein